MSFEKTIESISKEAMDEVIAACKAAEPTDNLQEAIQVFEQIKDGMKHFESALIESS